MSAPPDHLDEVPPLTDADAPSWAPPPPTTAPPPDGRARDYSDLTDAERRAEWDNAEDMPPPEPSGPEVGQGEAGPAVEPFPVRLLDTPPSPMRWLVGGLLPAGAVAVLAAEPKAGKTWLTFAVAIALATRGRVLDRWQADEAGRTLFYSPESGWAQRTARLWGLCWGVGLDPLEVAPSMPFIDAPLDLTRDEHVARLRATCAAERPRLVVVDPLVNAALGLDENASGDVMRVLAPLRELATDNPELTVLVVHHHNKGARERSRSGGLRGSSAIGGWWDSLVTLTRAEDRSDAPRRLDVEHRDAAAPDPSGFTLATGPATADGHPELSWFRLDPCEAPELALKTGAGGGRKLDADDLVKVYTLIAGANGQLTRKAGAARLGWNHHRFNRYFERLVSQEKARLGKSGCMEVAE